MKRTVGIIVSAAVIVGLGLRMVLEKINNYSNGNRNDSNGGNDGGSNGGSDGGNDDGSNGTRGDQQDFDILSLFPPVTTDIGVFDDSELVNILSGTSATAVCDNDATGNHTNRMDNSDNDDSDINAERIDDSAI